MAAKDALYLIDGNAQFHRAYHAIRGLATGRGMPTNATVHTIDWEFVAANRTGWVQRWDREMAL